MNDMHKPFPVLMRGQVGHMVKHKHVSRDGTPA